MLELDTSDGPVEVHLEGVRELAVPRVSPWGASSSVNAMEVSSGVVVLAMQSGDRLVFKAEAFHLRRAVPRWGDTVKIREDSKIHPGGLGSVCGLVAKDRDLLVLIEFSDGTSAEVSATSLELISET